MGRASIGDPALVPQVVASVLGVSEQPGRPLTATLADYLRHRSLLLVLDNCEHLRTACAQHVSALLHGSPTLCILATSRVPLSVPGETLWRVPSLSLPPPHRLPPRDDIPPRIVESSPKSREEVAEKYLGFDPARQSFIVEADGMLIGYIQAWSDEPPDGGIDIVLVAEAQGRGLGVDAVRALSAHLRAAGWRQIIVDPVARNRRAIRALEKAGFVKIGELGEHVLLAFEPETGSV